VYATAGWLRCSNEQEKGMSAVRAVVVDPGAPGRLVLREVEAPSPAADEAVVRVEAVSLNRGEVRRAASAEEGHRPGWDLAGTVEQAAADGPGPRVGARVVGLLPSGAWAELVAVPSHSLAELPDEVGFEAASTLPVAGLTALYALEKGGSVLGRRVLVTGASGGVGHFAVQLARLAGAHVVGLVRQPGHAGTVREAGAHDVAVSEDASAARQYGPYDLVIEGVGGQVLAGVLTMLAPNSTCVVFGATAAPDVTFQLGPFYVTGGASIYGFMVFHETRYKPASEGLARLARLVADGQIQPRIEVEAPWTDVGEVARRLLDRGYTGKAVLRVGN
jgi:NADPH:quinone reductase-like Zn-dependent oxidoreductase